MHEIVVNGLTYVRKDIKTSDENFNIVVLDRGFVYIGYTRIENKMLIITNAKNLRRWGTTKGLAELIDGPTENTKVDPVSGEIKVPMHAVIHLIAAKAAAWK